MPRSPQSIPGNREQNAFTRMFLAVLRLAEQQWGVVADWQLIDCGVSRSAISRWVASGRLQRLYPRVYSVGHAALRTEGRLLAAILYAGPGAALSHASAAHWWELIAYLPSPIHVTCPRRRRSLTGVYIHHVAGMQRVMHNGLPVTPVAKTLLDFASVAPFDQVRTVVSEADFLHLLNLEAIDRITGAGRAGSNKLDRALSVHRPEYVRTRSPLEDLFLDVCRRHRLPFPEVNVTLGPYTVDTLWPDARLIVELDGGDGHSSYGQMQRDRERDLYLRRCGYAIHRYSWWQVTRRGTEVAADLRRALRAACGPASTAPS